MIWADEIGAAVAHVYNRSEMASDNHATQAANARLIAAAPDLLAQLAAFVEFANDWHKDNMPEDWKASCICANAAIDRATR